MANCYFAKPHGMQHCYIPFLYAFDFKSAFKLWRGAAFNEWHEPDESRGSSPESVSGSGCDSPGRLGPVMESRRPIQPGSLECLGCFSSAG
jgi:hypothetical protein